jgi:hypothetical protein
LKPTLLAHEPSAALSRQEIPADSQVVTVKIYGYADRGLKAEEIVADELAKVTLIAAPKELRRIAKSPRELREWNGCAWQDMETREPTVGLGSLQFPAGQRHGDPPGWRRRSALARTSDNTLLLFLAKTGLA